MIRATWTNGRFVPDKEVNLPEGTIVYLVEAPAEESLNANADGMPPEEIARVLDAMDRMEPLSWTDQEYAAWEQDRQARKEWEKARFMEHGEELRGMFE
jgi:predicted DNA-binding antitoxin AbrB/MazE fold protein